MQKGFLYRVGRKVQSKGSACEYKVRGGVERDSIQSLDVRRWGEHIGVNLAQGTMKGIVRDGENSVRSVQIWDRGRGIGRKVCTQAELRYIARTVRHPFD
jgi:hypothetical protein